MKYILITIAIWNGIVFILYGIDKAKAVFGKWRISENTLIFAAFALGGIGALAGMEIWRHKTRHSKFRILVSIAAIATAAVVYLGCKGLYVYVHVPL